MNLYEIIGVAPTASLTEIKRAYRKAIRKCHPDVAGHEEDVEKAAALNKAYAVLSDTVRRAYYDATGDEDPEVDKMQDDISSNFMQLIEAVLGSYVTDPIRAAHENINKQILSINIEIDARKKRMQMLRKLRDHIVADEGVENLFHMAIDAKCASAEHYLINAAKSLEVVEGVEKRIKQFRFTGPSQSSSASSLTLGDIIAQMHGGSYR